MDASPSVLCDRHVGGQRGPNDEAVQLASARASRRRELHESGELRIEGGGEPKEPEHVFGGWWASVRRSTRGGDASIAGLWVSQPHRTPWTSTRRTMPCTRRIVDGA